VAVGHQAVNRHVQPAPGWAKLIPIDSISFPMTRIQQGGRSLGAVAAALLLSTSSTLPAIAALPQQQRFQAGPALASNTDFLLAEKDTDDKKNKKKKNQQTQQKQQKQQQSQPKRKTQSSPSQTNKNKISDKQREKIYQQGRQDGIDKGKQRGYNKGYDKGFDSGKQKGKDKGYRKAQRQEYQSWNRNQWNRYNSSRRNIWVAPVRYNRPFYGNPGWAQSPNWGYNRPWGGGGWYNSGSPGWGWWGGQALGWGINALTTALIVNNAVNRAIRDRQPTVMVPNSSMQLYYGSVEVSDRTDVSFMVTNGNYTYQMDADCEDGLLNGEVPTSLAEAELVNTACQVAFGAV
jgi:hypothetical protein